MRLEGNTKEKGVRKLNSSFNSILVRLEVELLDEDENELPVFQFHTGAIRSSDISPVRMAVFSVSIPYWCD